MAVYYGVHEDTLDDIIFLCKNGFGYKSIASRLGINVADAKSAVLQYRLLCEYFGREFEFISRSSKIGTRIVAISGKARSGKDTTASFLKEIIEESNKKVLIMHYADLLKWICREFFGWDGNKDEDGRAMLQRVGTDVVRRKKPDFWVNFVIDFIEMFMDEWDYILIPDARFHSEVNNLKTKFGSRVVHLRITRPGFDNGLTAEQKSHPSESSIDTMQYDYKIVNNGTLEDLRALSLKFAERIGVSCNE